MDLGCGWGAVGVALKAITPELSVVMTDINSRAVALAERNLALNGLKAEVVQGDGFASVEGGFDAIITNPPFAPERPSSTASSMKPRSGSTPAGSSSSSSESSRGLPRRLSICGSASTARRSSTEAADTG